jgi:hypothetical protein
MTIPEQPKRKSALEIALDEKLENDRKKASQTPVIIPQVKVETLSDITSEADLKSLSARIEYESKLEGYKSFKERESALKDGEKELEAEALALGQQREKFEAEQVERVRVANSKLEEAKKAMDLYKTKIADANAIMEKAQKLQSEADRVLKAQSEAEKEANEKQKAYEENMVEVVDVFTEIATHVSNEGYPVGGVLKYDVALINRIQDKKMADSLIAGIITIDLDRIGELCQTIQDSGKNQGLLDYLDSNTDYISKLIKIKWTPSTVEVLT